MDLVIPEESNNIFWFYNETSDIENHLERFKLGLNSGTILINNS